MLISNCLKPLHHTTFRPFFPVRAPGTFQFSNVSFQALIRPVLLKNFARNFPVLCDSESRRDKKFVAIFLDLFEGKRLQNDLKSVKVVKLAKVPSRAAEGKVKNSRKTVKNAEICGKNFQIQLLTWCWCGVKREKKKKENLSLKVRSRRRKHFLNFPVIYIVLGKFQFRCRVVFFLSSRSVGRGAPC